MSKRVSEAQAAVAEARLALIDTARGLQQRLQPKTLAREAWESAKNKGADIAEDAVDAVKRRPVATGGIIAAVAMFLARQPIKDGVIRIYDAMTSDDEDNTPPAEAEQTIPAATPVIQRKRRAPRPARQTEIE